MKRIRFIIPCVALLFVLALVPIPTAFVQSGRIKEKNPKSPGTTARQDRPGPTNTSKPQPSPPQPQKPKTDDEVEDQDIVRISSTLVPIPASVVDAGGNAITGLKLEDFELRVDGHVRPISEMTRADTQVKLVMLFDNSGSVFLSREFEKQAAKRFFRECCGRPTKRPFIPSSRIVIWLNRLPEIS
ncbi:MAG TPA: hypothetical protein VJV03_03505 [Pyrinomonadaceae bacterium]|nr:hypothetical protein [Pyrinomonadaceae bacterium]